MCKPARLVPETLYAHATEHITGTLAAKMVLISVIHRKTCCSRCKSRISTVDHATYHRLYGSSTSQI